MFRNRGTKKVLRSSKEITLRKNYCFVEILTYTELHIYYIQGKLHTLYYLIFRNHMKLVLLFLSSFKGKKLRYEEVK